MFQRIKHKENGDTIVEVLISLAILTLVLGGAYYTANLSLRNDEDSQEHTEALTLAQTQLEDLRAYGTGFPANDACLSNSDSTLQPTDGCNFPNNAIGQPETSCPPTDVTYCYAVNISQVATPAPIQVNNGVESITVTFHTYKINVSWTALGGGNDDVSLYYRMDTSSEGGLRS